MKGAESTRLRRGTRADIAKLSRLISVIASLRCDTHRARCLPAGLDVLCHPERSEGSSGCFFFNNGRLPRPLCMVPVFAHSLERGLRRIFAAVAATFSESSRKDDLVRAIAPGRCLPRLMPFHLSVIFGGYEIAAVAYAPAKTIFARSLTPIAMMNLCPSLTLLAMTNLSLRSLTPYRNDDSFAVVAATPSQRPCSRRYPDRASCLTGGLPLLAPELETFRSKPFHRQQLPQEHDKALARRSGGQDELAHPAMIDIHT